MAWAAINPDVGFGGAHPMLCRILFWDYASTVVKDGDIETSPWANATGGDGLYSSKDV